MFNFPKIKNLPPYRLGDVAKRIHEIRSSGADVIDLSQLNPTIPPPQIAIDKLVQSSLISHNHRYSASAGIVSLRDGLSKYYQEKFSCEIVPNSEVVVTSGTKEGIVHLLMSILSPGDSVLVPVPTYPVHSAAAALAGVTSVGIPLWKSFEAFVEAGGVLDENSEYFFSRLKNRFVQTWPRPKAILINFPHNPTTTIVTAGFYERLVGFAKTNNCLLVNDFAHGDLFFEAKDRVSLLSVDGAKDVGVEIYSLSKGFCLAGWRVGAALGNVEALGALRSLKSYTDFGLFQPLQIAAAHLLMEEIKSGFSYINEVLTTYQYRRNLALDSLKALDWNIFTPKASPFIWAKIPSRFHSGGVDSFCSKLLEQKNVALFPGTAFDSEQENCVRISLIENESRLREAIRRIADFQQDGHEERIG